MLYAHPTAAAEELEDQQQSRSLDLEDIVLTRGESRERPTQAIQTREVRVPSSKGVTLDGCPRGSGPSEVGLGGGAHSSSLSTYLLRSRMRLTAGGGSPRLKFVTAFAATARTKRWSSSRASPHVVVTRLRSVTLHFAEAVRRD